MGYPIIRHAIITNEDTVKQQSPTQSQTNEQLLRGVG